MAARHRVRGSTGLRLGRLDFRSESLGPALAKMARHVERTIRETA
jgi:hypothetical protein